MGTGETSSNRTELVLDEEHQRRFFIVATKLTEAATAASRETVQAC